MQTVSILNVGLTTKHGGKVFLHALLKDVGPYRDITIHDSDTEPTAVIQLPLVLTEDKLNDLCRRHEQDCIAVYYPKSNTGHLSGPGAHKWGSFQHEFFLMPNGLSLQAQQVFAA